MRKSSQAHTLFELARGGMGRIDLVSVRDGTFLRLHVVKRLHQLGRDDPEFRAMFLDEARIAGLIRHANVVSVLDVDEDDDGPFLVMDYVEGVSLKDVIVHHQKQRELPPIQLCARIASQIALGLHAAHELTTPQGKPLEIVHRDVSPQNVIVGFDGVVRVTDFGVAKAQGRSTRTGAGVLKGKLGYFSPEQLRFEEPDRRSDLFALGVILYEMLTAERLYANRNGTEGALRTLTEPPPDVGEARPDMPSLLVELVFELLAKDQNDRPRTAREVARRLDAIIAELSATEGPLELSEFMETTFGDVRSSLRERVARKLEDLDPVAAEAIRADGVPPTTPILPQQSSAIGSAPSPGAGIPVDSTEAGPGAMTKGTKSGSRRERRGVWIASAVLFIVVAAAIVISRTSSTQSASEPATVREQPAPAPTPSTLGALTTATPEPDETASVAPEPLSASKALAPLPRDVGTTKPHASAAPESTKSAKPSPFDSLGPRE